MPTTRRRMSPPFALSIFILTFAGSAFAQTPASPAAPNSGQATTQPPAQVLGNWREGMARVPPPPKPGCFTAAHPSTEWQEVPCATAPEHQPRAASGAAPPPTVGSGTDVVAQVAGNLMSSAMGSFDSVSGVTSGMPSTFTLQLNSNKITTTPACNGGAPGCVGWQQFIYSTTQCQGSSCAFIQNWLNNYRDSNVTACPSGWNTGGTSGCFINSQNVPVPLQDVTNLVNLSLMGQANVNGMDQVIMSTGSNLYMVQQPANMLYLYQGWVTAEFGIFGDGGGSQANFNGTSTLVVRTSVNNGSPTAPSCVDNPNYRGYTGESNNLYFASPPVAPARRSLPALVFTISSGGSASSPCAAATTIAAASRPHDFNGDGKSDILFRNTNGGVAMWLMNGATIASALGVASTTTDWAIVGQRDFFGYGFADILWRASNGGVAMWQMNGATLLSLNPLGGVPTDWVVAGTGDFNGDGIGDILLSGGGTALGIWFMNGSATVASAVGVGSLPNGWSVAGSGDFNGDGVWDILLYYQPSGAVAVWLMNGNGTIRSTAALGSLPVGTWSIAGTGDFNGDGISDVLLSGSGNAVGIWFMNPSGTVASAQGVGTMASGWTIVQTGDYNGDGMSDILWYYGSSGAIATWLMNGATVTASAGIGSLPPSSWMLVTANSD